MYKIAQFFCYWKKTEVKENVRIKILQHISNMLLCQEKLSTFSQRKSIRNCIIMKLLLLHLFLKLNSILIDLPFLHHLEIPNSLLLIHLQL